MSDFSSFSKLIHAHYLELSKHELYVSNISGDDLWAAYLTAFPPGTNPIYKERTEHDCSCCKNFIRNIGNLVAIVDGKPVSVWAVDGAQHPYDKIVNAMDLIVSNAGIKGVFRTKERSYGAEVTHSQDGALRPIKTWHHYHAQVMPRHYHASPAEARGALDTTFAVFKRGMEEITTEALDTVLDLIRTNGLYRGAEHEAAVRAFYQLKTTGITDTKLWTNISSPVARLRNTVIGTLLVDLSTGVDLEHAVKSFEQKVAPANYKRPTALITKGMVDQAMKTLQELDLESALERRFAKISDISVHNVLWVSGTARSRMKSGGVAETLLKEVASNVDESKLRRQVIGVNDFMSKIVPWAKSMDVFIKNAQQGKFVSLTAPAATDTKRLFKWSNDFGWAYDGGVTDSIKERVKRAGGNVTNAKLRVSLAWFNLDDLDIHCFPPDGSEIYYGDRQGVLDVDMNAGSGTTREPVENLSWKALNNGVYKIVINQFHQRETDNVGFELEVESDGVVQHYTHKTAVKGRVAALNITVQRGQVTDIWVAPGLVGGLMSAEKWGVKTEAFTPVTTLMCSPNHWDNNGVGNKHWFFILDKCVNPEPVRGIFNEFLSSNLDKHRKVFEVLGNKMLCPHTPEQLSGVGFSSTLNDEVLVRVTSNSSTQLYNVEF